MNALKKRGVVITIRGCQWQNLKDTVRKRSPYSQFYYKANITSDMILSSVYSGAFFGLLEVDLVTPVSIKNEFEKINFATIFNKIIPSPNMLSKTMLERCHRYGVAFPLNPQLTLVYDAKNYLVTSETLNYYLHLGMTVTTIHYCVEYQRSKPLKQFIDLSRKFIIIMLLSFV